MKFKNCEEYVLAELEKAQDTILDLKEALTLLEQAHDKLVQEKTRLHNICRTFAKNTENRGTYLTSYVPYTQTKEYELLSKFLDSEKGTNERVDENIDEQ